MSATPKSTDVEAIRSKYYKRIEQHQLSPLWTFFHDWFTPVPRVHSKPYLWRYTDLRDEILASADVIDPIEAERRVLVLENPGLPDRLMATESLYAGLQVIMPGEVAPCHRHSPCALRFVVESAGAYTAVSGERAYMRPGDFIITPSWTWHDHGNEGDGPTVWLDVLDVAMIHLFNASFTEHYPEQRSPQEKPAFDTLYRYGSNMLPVEYKRGPGASPIFSYPYERTRETLDRLKAHSDLDPCHALKMQYIDPTTGGSAIPTIATFMQLLPTGFSTKPYKTTAGTIFCVVEGRGKFEIDVADDTVTLEYEPWDIIVVPSWQAYRIKSSEESIIFGASDQAAQEKLGFWREERGD